MKVVTTVFVFCFCMQLCIVMHAVLTNLLDTANVCNVLCAYPVVVLVRCLLGPLGLSGSTYTAGDSWPHSYSKQS